MQRQTWARRRAIGSIAIDFAGQEILTGAKTSAQLENPGDVGAGGGIGRGRRDDRGCAENRTVGGYVFEKQVLERTIGGTFILRPEHIKTAVLQRDHFLTGLYATVRYIDEHRRGRRVSGRIERADEDVLGVGEEVYLFPHHREAATGQRDRLIRIVADVGICIDLNSGGRRAHHLALRVVDLHKRIAVEVGVVELVPQRDVVAIGERDQMVRQIEGRRRTGKIRLYRAQRRMVGGVEGAGEHREVGGRVVAAPFNGEIVAAERGYLLWTIRGGAVSRVGLDFSGHRGAIIVESPHEDVLVNRATAVVARRAPHHCEAVLSGGRSDCAPWRRTT